MNFTWDCCKWTLLETASNELYLRLHPMNFTWACCQWTLLETVVSALYLSLLSVNFTWDCCQWTLLETASNELCLRLHPINFTWGCIQWTLLGPVASELYLRLLSVNFTEVAIIALCTLLETALNEFCFKLNACNLFLRENLIIFYFFQEKCHKFLTHFWRTFDALLKSASKVHQKAVKVRQKCIKSASLLKVHQKCIKSASKVHQKCTKSASKVHQKCIKSASKVHQKCTKSASKVRQKCIKSAPKASEVHCIFDRVQAFFWTKLWTHVKKIFIWNWKRSKGLTKTSWMYLFKPAKGLPGFHPDLLQIVWEKSTTRVYELPFKFSFEKDMSSVPMDNCFM